MAHRGCSASYTNLWTQQWRHRGGGGGGVHGTVILTGVHSRGTQGTSFLTKMLPSSSSEHHASSGTYRSLVAPIHPSAPNVTELSAAMVNARDNICLSAPLLQIAACEPRCVHKRATLRPITSPRKAMATRSKSCVFQAQAPVSNNMGECSSKSSRKMPQR